LERNSTPDCCSWKSPGKDGWRRVPNRSDRN